MVAKDQKLQSKKRKRAPKQSQKPKPNFKKPKQLQSKPSNPSFNKTSLKPSKNPKFKTSLDKNASPSANTPQPQSKKEGRLLSKQLAEARKKKRKPHYTLQQELASLWEKMRRRNIAKDGRSKLISEALHKMKGKIPEIATSHVSSRVLQTCVKYCSQAERESVFDELRPHLLNLSRNAYAVHLVKKMLDNVSKSQLEVFISSLHGHVASLLRHTVGSVVVEHAFQLANGFLKQSLLLELYCTELQLFKDLTLTNESRVVDLISKYGLQKSSVFQHMSNVIQPLLEKGIVDHSIIHSLLMEYLSIADKSSAADVLQQLSGPLLVRMIHTRNGASLGILSVKYGSSKESKKIIKGMKGLIGKVAYDQYGSMVLVCILSVVDDTKLVTKVVIKELQLILKELVLDKNGRRPLLQLLHPDCPRYFGPDDLVMLKMSLPALCNVGERSELEMDTESENEKEPSETVSHKDSDGDEERLEFVNGSKKDPSLRRVELLVNSGLAESLIDTCIECAGVLLMSNFGREVIYEVASGGAGGILRETLAEKVDALHEAISNLAALPKDDSEQHLFMNFHSSRTIRKLVLDCPGFAATLWKAALEGKCEMWAQGHSCKVVSAFIESSDSSVRDMVRCELQPLIERGLLKVSETKHADH